MTNTAFGPQGANAATALPGGGANNRYGDGVDTWVRNCTATGQDGTILDAAFFNMIIGNLRQVIADANDAGAGIAITDGNHNLLSQAIQYFGDQSGTLSFGDGLQVVNGQLELDVQTLKVMIA